MSLFTYHTFINNLKTFLLFVLEALKVFEDNYKFDGFSREQELKERENDYR